MAKNDLNDKKRATKEPKSTEVIEAEEVVTEAPEPETLAPEQQKRRLNSSQIVWGLILVFFGLLLLLDNLGFVDLNWMSLWKLWPLAIILGGLAVLDLKGWVGVLITAIVIALSGGLVLATLTGNLDEITGTEERSEKVASFNVERERDIERAEVTLKSGAGKIEVSDHRRGDLVRGELTSVVTQLTRESKVEDGVQEVELSLERGFKAWGLNPANNFDVSLTRSVPIDLRLDSGAASIKADLEKVQVRSVEVDAGASSVWLKLGEEQEEVKVDIDTGASSVDIRVPENAGVKLNLDAGLSSRNLPGDLEETDKGSYKSENYDDSAVKININADMGLSSFKLVRY